MLESLWTGKGQALGRLALHGGEHDTPWAWSWEPSVVLGVAVFAGAYLYGVGPLRQRYRWAEYVDPRQVALFLLGTLIFFLTLVSPLDVISDEYLFSAHMVQHILLSMVVVPLWLLGTPGWLLRPLVRPRVVMRVARALTLPAVALLLFNGNFWMWHWPALYEAALADERIHILQHLTFVATGVINWWPVLGPAGVLPRPSYPAQLIYLAVNCQPNVALGAVFVFARGLIYDAYVDAPRLFGLAPQGDQQLGGLIMWIPGNAIYLLALSAVFFRWLQHQESPEAQGNH